MSYLGLVVLLTAVSSTFAASPEVWNPELKFKLETSSYIEALHWISGFSYALAESAKETAKLRLTGPYCVPQGGHIGSKEIVDTLNEKFADKTITSEMAASAVMQTMKARFPCSANRAINKAK